MNALKVGARDDGSDRAATRAAPTAARALYYTKLRPAKWDAVVNLRRRNSELCMTTPGQLEASRAPSRRIYKHMREA